MYIQARVSRVDYIFDVCNVIVTSYKFEKCGNITQWNVTVHHNLNHTVIFWFQVQVWRLVQTLPQTCYSLVSKSHKVTFSVILSKNNSSGNQRQINDGLEVKPGDMVGFLVSGPVKDVSIAVNTTDQGGTTEWCDYAVPKRSSNPYCSCINENPS